MEPAHKINDEIKVTLGYVIQTGTVEAYKFTNWGKVLYDIKIMQNDGRPFVVREIPSDYVNVASKDIQGPGEDF